MHELEKLTVKAFKHVTYKRALADFRRCGLTGEVKLGLAYLPERTEFVWFNTDDGIQTIDPVFPTFINPQFFGSFGILITEVENRSVFYTRNTMFLYHDKNLFRYKAFLNEKMALLKAKAWEVPAEAASVIALYKIGRTREFVAYAWYIETEECYCHFPVFEDDLPLFKDPKGQAYPLSFFDWEYVPVGKSIIHDRTIFRLCEDADDMLHLEQAPLQLCQT